MLNVLFYKKMYYAIVPSCREEVKLLIFNSIWSFILNIFSIKLNQFWQILVFVAYLRMRFEFQNVLSAVFLFTWMRNLPQFNRVLSTDTKNNFILSFWNDALNTYLEYIQDDVNLWKSNESVFTQYFNKKKYELKNVVCKKSY